jgi:hypothetical protein
MNRFFIAGPAGKSQLFTSASYRVFSEFPEQQEGETGIRLP